MEDKIRIKVPLCPCTFNGTINELIDYLKDLEKKYSEKYINLYIEEELNHEECISYELYGYRLETDKEFSKRRNYDIKVEEQRKKDVEKTRIRELRELRRLCKKYKKELETTLKKTDPKNPKDWMTTPEGKKLIEEAIKDALEVSKKLEKTMRWPKEFIPFK